MTATLDELREQASEGMRGYLALKGAARAEATHTAAEAVAQAREHFETRNGDPDLLGRSSGYREWLKETMDYANVPDAARNNLQAALRFRISPILHERHGDELARRGLTAGSAAERGRHRKARERRTLALFGGGSPVTDLDDALLIANLARLATNRVISLPEATPHEASVVSTNFAQLAKAAREASRRLSPD